jgi:hypothetical protein
MVADMTFLCFHGAMLLLGAISELLGARHAT